MSAVDFASAAHARLVHGARAAGRLAVARSWLEQAESGEAVLVLGASELAAADLMRDVAEVRGAIFGWQRDTLARFAAELAAPALAERGLAPGGALVMEALAARVVHRVAQAGELGRFAAIGDQPGLPRALLHTWNELRGERLGGAELAGRQPELARLLAAFEEELTASAMADRLRVLELAAAEARSAAPRGCMAALVGAPLLLLDVPVSSAVEAELIAALAARSSAVLATAPSGDARSIDGLAGALGVTAEDIDRAASTTSLGRLQQSLFAPPPGEQPLGDDVEVLSAPGESRECVEIARRILREAERGVAFDRMAVLLRAPERYRPHLEEALRRAGVPAYFARGSVQPDPAGRALAALLACAAEGLSARRFAEYLSLGELPRPAAGEPPPPLPASERWVVPDDELVRGAPEEEGDDGADDPLDNSVEDDAAPRAPRRWERLLVDAAVIGGSDRWRRRLTGLNGEIHREIAALAQEDPQSPRIEQLRRRIADLTALRSFALPLLDDLAALPERALWGVWLDRLGALATRAIQRPERVLATLAELQPMAAIGPIDLRQVRWVLERRLAELVVRPAARRQGRLLVAPCEGARGMAFDVVFIPGVAERLFPQKVIEDPILRDRERAAIGPGLVTLDDRVQAERLALRLAVGAATKRVVVSYPRLDVDQGRPRVPSFYGLEVLHAATGRLPGFDELGRRADRGGAARIGWPAPATPADAIDEAEHDLALLDDLLARPVHETLGTARFLLDANPHLGRALRFRARRWIKRWTPADGLVQPSEAARAALAGQQLPARSYSATALQHYARCPYAFYLHALLKLSPREEREAIEELDPLARGSMVHEIQFELLETLRDRGLVPLSAANLAAAQALLEDVLDHTAKKYEDELAPAIARVWEDAIATIRADLREWLRRASEEPNWTPWRFELAFGLEGRQGRDPTSRTADVPLDAGIRLRGSIDLVEKSAAGTLRATDHKTGKVRAEEGAIIGGGETLQPVLYALALEKLIPEMRVEAGRLYYCTATGRFEERVFPLDDNARAAAAAVAQTIGRALETGFLPAAPRDKDTCRYCDYRSLCGPYEWVRASSVKPQRELVPLHKLRRMP